jgi:LPS-assembly protein
MILTFRLLIRLALVAVLAGSAHLGLSASGRASMVPPPPPASALPVQTLAQSPPAAPAATPAPVSPRASDEVLFRADQMSYDARAQVVTASGNVEVTQGGRTLTADRVTYDQKTNIVVAEGHVSLSDGEGNALVAEKIELKDDMKDGLIESLTVMLAEKGKLAAARATRERGTVMTLEKAVYSSCETCKDRPQDPPVWQIKAFRVVYDKEKARVEYEDAFFEILGIPVVYLPYFSHSDPSVKRQSGFLAPNLGHSTDIGYFVDVPYFWALDPSYDLTAGLMWTEHDSTLIKTEWRERLNYGSYYLQGSATYAEARDVLGVKTGEETFSSHLFGQGRFEIDETWRWGYDLQLSSSDTYLKRYDISSLDRLINNVFFEGIEGRSYASINAWYFQGLRETDDPGKTPLVLPLAELTYVPDEPVFGGRFQLDASLLSLYRGEGRDSTRISATADWKLPYTTVDGQLWTIFAQARGDVYFTQDDGPLGDQDNTVGRFLPTGGVEWRWPFVRHDGEDRMVIEPIVQAVLAPYGGNPAEVPNDDSDSFEFDETNLFSINKFPGLDRWESGPRINAGLRAAAYYSGDNFVELLFGQTYRFKEDKAFTVESGLRDQQSDFVGRVIFQPLENLRIVHRFRLDKDDLSFERNEVYLEAQDGDFYRFTASYVNLNQEALAPDAREELYLNGKVQFADRWYVKAMGRRDLDEDKMIEARGGLSYEDECSEFGVDLKRRFTRDRDIEPNTSVIFTFRLKGIN